jgi:hypothetical protein
MKISTIKKLQEQFTGKVCTILTVTVNKVNFTDQQFFDFFTGRIDSIDEDGIFARHHITGCVNFYCFEHITGVLEEQIIEETDPKYTQIVEDIKKNSQQTVNSNPSNNLPPLETTNNQSQFIDTDMLKRLQNQTKMLQKNN